MSTDEARSADEVLSPASNSPTRNSPTKLAHIGSKLRKRNSTWLVGKGWSRGAAAQCIQMVLCPNPACPMSGKDFMSLDRHFRHSPGCRPLPMCVAAEPEPRPENTAVPEDLDTVETVFSNKFQSVLMKGFNDRHYFEYVKAGHLNHMNSMMMECMVELEQYALRVGSAAKDVPEATDRLTTAFELAREQIQMAHSAAARTRYNKTKLKAPYVEPQPYRPLSTQAARKGAMRFSLIELYTRLLQRDSAARVSAYHKHSRAVRAARTLSAPHRRRMTCAQAWIMQQSDKYKSGELHGWQPKIISSWLDGKKARFDPDFLRKATEEEQHDVRIAAQVLK